MHDPIDVVNSLYAAFAEDDHETVRRTLADHVVWRQAAVGVVAAGEDRVGADALVEEVVLAIDDDWRDFTETVEHIDACGPRVVATGTYRGEHRRSGCPLTAELGHLWMVEDGRITASRQYTDTAGFVTAASP